MKIVAKSVIIVVGTVASNVGGKVVGFTVAAGLSASGAGTVAAPIGYFIGNAIIGVAVAEGQKILYRWFDIE